MPTKKKRKTRKNMTLGCVVEAYLADRDLAPTTKRTYKTAFRVLREGLGDSTPMTDVDARKVKAILGRHWGKAAPTTYNARMDAIHSLCRYARKHGWMHHDPVAGLERKRMPRTESQAIAYDELEALWLRDDIPLREKLLWNMLYSTAARASEILGLNVCDLDLRRKRARITRKGGHREFVFWDAATARLLKRYLAGRKSGPVFLANRLPWSIPADCDLAPDGRARLSYQQAWAIFKETSGGWTLHQLRHSALTHLGEAGVSAPLLMAKSGHVDPRTLARYVQPGSQAVAQLTAEFDRARRHPR